MMKLRPIYESILNEIGDSAQVPPGVKFNVGEQVGNCQFKFLESNYKIEIRIPIQNENKIALTVDFYTTDESNRFKPGDYDLTNKGQPLKVMSFIVGSIEEWINQYKEKFHQNDDLEVIYIKYDPKSENAEDFSNTDGNSRHRLYRIFIEKYAKRNGSSVTFSTTGGIVAQFKPPLTIE